MTLGSRALVGLLRQSGHEAIYVYEVSPRATDIAAMNPVQRDHRLLLTEDKDFGDLVFRQARPIPGIVLIRIGVTQRQSRAERLTAAIRRFGETLFGRYTVIKAALFFRCDLSGLYEWYRRPAPDGVGSSFRPRAPPHRVPDRRRVTRRGR